MQIGRRRTWSALGAAVGVLAALSPSGALGAVSSWEFEASSYDFGSVTLGSHPTHQFILTNTGETPIAAGRLRIHWRGHAPLDQELLEVVSNGCLHLTLEPEESCPIEVSFKPTYPGPKEGGLEVKPYELGEAAPANVEIEGEGIGPWTALTPEHLLFGPVEVGTGASPSQAVTVENQGNLGLSINGLFFTDLLGEHQWAGPFQITGGSCQSGKAVAPGGKCIIEVALAPSQTGFFQSRLAVSDNAFGSPQSIELQGTVTASSRVGEGLPESFSKPRQVSTRVHITGHPALVTGKRGAAFSFSAVPSGAKTECKLDHRAFETCSSPKRYAHLSIGRHKFQVRLHDPSNSVTSPPADFRWRIRRHA
jgi:hypothetical protein